MELSRQITAQIREVLEKHPEGLSITDLVRSVDINRNTAARYLENLLLSGQVEMRRFGMAKIYSLAKRLPVSSVLSLSSELVLQLDFGQRVIYANEPLLTFLCAQAKDLSGKNIEFTPFSIVFEDVYSGLNDRFRKGLKGEEWNGELPRPVKGRYFFCRVTPTVSNEGKKGVTVLLDDISDQKRDEERIRKSEARLRSIFKVSPVGIGVMVNRVLLEVNDRFCQMTGYSDDELVGKSMRILYPSDEEFDRAGARKYNQIRQTGTGTVETRWVKKDGTEIDILMSSTPLDPANISGGTTFTAQDVTERNQAALALKKSEERYRTVFENTGAATMILEENTIISLVNDEFERLSGYTREEIEMKKSWTEFVVKEDLERMLALHYLRREGGKIPRQYEFRVVIKNGDIRHALLRVELIPGTGQTVASLLDITDRKRTEEQLWQREQQYRFIADNSLDIINRLTPDYICTYVSPAITPLLGYPEMDVVGTSLLAMVHPDDLDKISRDLAAMAQNGAGNFPLTFRLRHRNGHYLWFETMTKIIRDEKTGQVREFLSIFRDITARKQYEKEAGRS
ncbi:MAG: PAS domain S-box protein [Methanoregula sp.]|nr:PAS domain S-box protein [Methanoregula sp.]